MLLLFYVVVVVLVVVVLAAGRWSLGWQLHWSTLVSFLKNVPNSIARRKQNFENFSRK